MVLYYGITMSECNGTIIFVIKLDECQIVKGRRLERVSLTLMNRALQGKHLHAEDKHHSIMKKGKQQYYGVQLENHIWWMAAFELSHETHDTYAWYF